VSRPPDRRKISRAAQSFSGAWTDVQRTSAHASADMLRPPTPADPTISRPRAKGTHKTDNKMKMVQWAVAFRAAAPFIRFRRRGGRADRLDGKHVSEIPRRADGVKPAAYRGYHKKRAEGPPRISPPLRCIGF